MKKNAIFTNLCLLIVVSISVLSCQKDKIDTKAEGEKLMQTSREWSKSAVSRNVEETLKYWTEDAVVISAGEPEFQGKAAIRRMVEDGLNNPNFEISWEPLKAEISESGDLGYLLENAKITMKDSMGRSQIQHFKSVTIWKKQADGTWKNVVDVMSPKKLK